MSTEIDDVKTEKKIEVNAEKRAFMKKFGKYAVVGVGMATLMTPTKSSACNYPSGGCSCGTSNYSNTTWDWSNTTWDWSSWSWSNN